MPEPIESWVLETLQEDDAWFDQEALRVTELNEAVAPTIRLQKYREYHCLKLTMQHRLLAMWESHPHCEGLSSGSLLSQLRRAVADCHNSERVIVINVDGYENDPDKLALSRDQQVILISEKARSKKTQRFQRYFRNSALIATQGFLKADGILDYLFQQLHQDSRVKRRYQVFMRDAGCESLIALYRAGQAADFNYENPTHLYSDAVIKECFVLTFSAKLRRLEQSKQFLEAACLINWLSGLSEYEDFVATQKARFVDELLLIIDRLSIQDFYNFLNKVTDYPAVLVSLIEQRKEFSLEIIEKFARLNRVDSKTSLARGVNFLSDLKSWLCPAFKRHLSKINASEAVYDEGSFLLDQLEGLPRRYRYYFSADEMQSVLIHFTSCISFWDQAATSWSLNKENIRRYKKFCEAALIDFDVVLQEKALLAVLFNLQQQIIWTPQWENNSPEASLLLQQQLYEDFSTDFVDLTPHAVKNQLDCVLDTISVLPEVREQAHVRFIVCDFDSTLMLPGGVPNLVDLDQWEEQLLKLKEQGITPLLMTSRMPIYGEDDCEFGMSSFKNHPVCHEAFTAGRIFLGCGLPKGRAIQYLLQELAKRFPDKYLSVELWDDLKEETAIIERMNKELAGRIPFCQAEAIQVPQVDPDEEPERGESSFAKCVEQTEIDFASQLTEFERRQASQKIEVESRTESSIAQETGRIFYRGDFSRAPHRRLLPALNRREQQQARVNSESPRSGAGGGRYQPESIGGIAFNRSRISPNTRWGLGRSGRLHLPPIQNPDQSPPLSRGNESGSLFRKPALSVREIRKRAEESLKELHARRQRPPDF